MKSNTTKSVPAIAMSIFKRSVQPAVILLSFLIVVQSCKKNDHHNPPSKAYDLLLVASDLVSPLTVVDPLDGTKRLFVVDQIGKIWITDDQGQKMPTPFIDISSKMVTLQPQYDERGLLGLAFHPNFKSNGQFYLFYSAPPAGGGPEPGASWNNITRVSEFKVSAGDPNHADPSSEKIIFQANHPQPNHNGGTIAFGPDGYLYMSIGDGGGADDVGPGHVEDWYKINKGGNGQDVTHNLLGNILRIDVNTQGTDKPYNIPADNPFVNAPGEDEIYAYGFRNPYRFSFDLRETHRLFVGDAGQGLYEEVSVVKKGGNYGWNVREGTHCFNTDDNTKERSSCPKVDSAGNPLIDPVIELKNTANPEGRGITIVVVGGNVYRGEKIPALYGKYIFGSFSSSFQSVDGEVFMASPLGNGLWPFEKMKFKSFRDGLGQYVKGFGQGLDGEVYVTTSKQLGPQGVTGNAYKLVLVDK